MLRRAAAWASRGPARSDGMILFRSEHRTYHKLMCTFVLAETVILCTAVPIVLVVENGEAEPAAAGANAGVEQASAQSVPVGRVFAGATAAITGLVLFSLVRRVSRHLVVMVRAWCFCSHGVHLSTD